MSTSKSTPPSSLSPDVPISKRDGKGGDPAKRNPVIRFWTFLASILGFRKLSNFSGFVILAGALLGFCLARFPYLNPAVYATAFAPGEGYYYHRGSGKIGMLIHLGAILPCGVLMIIQFIPKIRQKYLIVHRVNAYFVLTLLFIGLAGALMITRHAFGGDVSTQGAVYTLTLMVVVSASCGYYNIKKLQIEQHRKWMLRTAVYMSVIITIRIVMIIAALIISRLGGYYATWTCDEIAYTLNHNESLIARLGSPDCVNATDPFKVVAVEGNFGKPPIQLASSFRLTFGTATWISIFIHAVGLEIYLHLQPAETERLRAISYQKQLEVGAKYPGSAGLTSDRLGDARPYRPQ